jgi:hypothetical protein
VASPFEGIEMKTKKIAVKKTKKPAPMPAKAPVNMAALYGK